MTLMRCFSNRVEQWPLIEWLLIVRVQSEVEADGCRCRVGTGHVLGKAAVAAPTTLPAATAAVEK